jgi:heme A synthase
VFGVGVLVVGWLLGRIRGAYPGVFRIWIGLLVVLVAQAILGEVQYRNALPWGLVLVHVVLAATIWAFTLALAFTLWRPAVPLTRRSASR